MPNFVIFVERRKAFFSCLFKKSKRFSYEIVNFLLRSTIRWVNKQ